MTRRLLLLLPIAACLRADSEKDAEAVITSAAGDLSGGKPEAFLANFDRSLPEYEKFRAAVEALTGEANLTCSVEVLSGNGDEETRTLTLDWILRLDYKDDRPGYTRRQKTVTCKLRKIGKKWRIVAFEPVDLLAP